VIAKCDVSIGWAASGQNGGVTGFKKGLHLLLLLWAGVDVPMGVNKPGHRSHTASIHDGPACSAWRSRRYRNDVAGPHNNRAALDYGAVGGNDAGIRDGEVLGRKG
jgi:hypothetical protein